MDELTGTVDAFTYTSATGGLKHFQRISSHPADYQRSDRQRRYSYFSQWKISIRFQSWGCKHHCNFFYRCNGKVIGKRISTGNGINATKFYNRSNRTFSPGCQPAIRQCGDFFHQSTDRIVEIHRKADKNS